MSESRDSISNTFVVAIGISLVCSVLVSAAAVILKPQQERNETRYRQQIVLQVAGLYEPGIDVSERFAEIDARLVDLSNGEYVETMDALEFDPVAAAADPGLSMAIPADKDVAGLRRRAIYAPVYLVRDGDELDQVILPVYGKGLWSTMYGYVSLEADGNTVRGLRFYEHAETPGLGDQVEKDSWLDHWSGKQIYDEAGDVRVAVIKGQPLPGPNEKYQIDGMSGATLTGRGVTNLMHYWLGEEGFGPYLARISKEEPR